MTSPDFRALAEQLAGVTWSLLGEDERRTRVRAAKRAWLEQQLGGAAPAPRDFGPWLRAQPPEVQDLALGPRRGRLLRAGELAVERFTDPPGRPLSLAELAATVPEPFPMSGLDLDDDNHETR